MSRKDIVAPSGALHSQDHQVGQDHERTMKSTGPAADSLDPLFIEPVEGDGPGQDFFDNLAFMEEMVGIVVAETTDHLAAPIPEVWNGGRVQRFLRGEEIMVKRKFVEVLARCKRTTYTQKKVKDDEGNDTYIQIPKTALMYPFVVTQDTDKGKAYLKKILAEA